MIGKLHQGTLELFRHDPWLAFDLLGVARPIVGTPIARRAEVERAKPGRRGKVQIDYPDLVLVSKQGDKDKHGIVICVEAQGQLAYVKRWMLPYYQTAVAKDHEAQTWMVVVSFCERMSAAMAIWKVGPPPVVDALLLDVNSVPRIVDLEQARKRPTAAVLGAALHGCRGDIEAARTGIRATVGLPKDRRDSYIGTILAGLSEEDEDIMISEMSMQEQGELWEIERRSGGFVRGERQGRQEGRRATLVELILAVLDVRGVALDADDEARVRGCEAMESLERWARRAREVDVGSELFEEPR